MILKENIFNSVVKLKTFSVFPEYFISISAIYLLIVMVLVTYNVYGLMVQKAISNCVALILFMACYLILNDDAVAHLYGFRSAIKNDYLAIFTKFIVCFSSAIYFLIIADSLKEQKLISFEYIFIILLAVLGLVLLCGCNDLLTAYLALELSSLPLYLIAAFRKTSSYSIDSGIKYFIIGSISSALFLLGSSFIYGYCGSLHLSEFYGFFQERRLGPIGYIISQFLLFMEYDDSIYLASYLPKKFNYNILELGIVFIIISLFIKLALAPFHLWSLDVYEGAPSSSTFFFAIISKLSIFVFLVRFSKESLLYPAANSFQFYSVWIAIASIFVGSFGGLRQKKFKTILAYSSISHMGYALLSFSAFTLISHQMLFFYLIIYILAGLCTWSIVLALRIKRRKSSNKYSKELGDFSSLHKVNSPISFAFALTMFSIAGIPPLAGFLAKMNVFTAVVAIHYYFVALVTILFSVVATFYYIRIIKVLYFENTLVGKLYYPISYKQSIILSILVFLLVFFFINPNVFYLILYKNHFYLLLGYTDIDHEIWREIYYFYALPHWYLSRITNTECVLKIDGDSALYGLLPG